MTISTTNIFNNLPTEVLDIILSYTYINSPLFYDENYYRIKVACKFFFDTLTHQFPSPASDFLVKNYKFFKILDSEVPFYHSGRNIPTVVSFLLQDTLIIMHSPHVTFGDSFPLILKNIKGDEHEIKFLLNGKVNKCVVADLSNPLLILGTLEYGIRTLSLEYLRENAAFNQNEKPTPVDLSQLPQIILSDNSSAIMLNNSNLDVHYHPIHQPVMLVIGSTLAIATQNNIQLLSLVTPSSDLIILDFKNAHDLRIGDMGLVATSEDACALFHYQNRSKTFVCSCFVQREADEPIFKFAENIGHSLIIGYNERKLEQSDDKSGGAEKKFHIGKVYDEKTKMLSKLITPFFTSDYYSLDQIFKIDSSHFITFAQYEVNYWKMDSGASKLIEKIESGSFDPMPLGYSIKKIARIGSSILIANYRGVYLVPITKLRTKMSTKKNDIKDLTEHLVGKATGVGVHRIASVDFFPPYLVVETDPLDAFRSFYPAHCVPKKRKVEVFNLAKGV